MRGRSALLIAGLAIMGSALASAPAIARPIDKGHFHDVFTSDVYNCDGTPAQDSGNVSGNFLFNQRGSSPFPYYRESVHGTVVTTNLDTGGTYTNVFTANTRDHTIVDNGDGHHHHHHHRHRWFPLLRHQWQVRAQGPRPVQVRHRHRLQRHPR